MKDEEIRRRQIAAYEKFSQAVIDFVEEGGVGPQLGIMTGWVIGIHEHDPVEGVTCTSRSAKNGQDPLMSMAIAEVVFERFKMDAMGFGEEVS